VGKAPQNRPRGFCTMPPTGFSRARSVFGTRFEGCQFEAVKSVHEFRADIFELVSRGGKIALGASRGAIATAKSVHEFRVDIFELVLRGGKIALGELMHQPKRGRPSRYSAQVAMSICDRPADGESLRAICSDAGMKFFDHPGEAQENRDAARARVI
jgi:hypothetical protein